MPIAETHLPQEVMPEKNQLVQEIIRQEQILPVQNAVSVQNNENLTDVFDLPKLEHKFGGNNYSSVNSEVSQDRNNSVQDNGSIGSQLGKISLDLATLFLNSDHLESSSVTDAPLLNAANSPYNTTAESPVNEIDSPNDDEDLLLEDTTTDEVLLDELPSRRGVLQVRITEFLNPSNKDADGDCCMKDSASSSCGGYCRLFFRVCATHSSRNVLLAQPATPPPQQPPIFLPTTLPPEDRTDSSSRGLFSMPSLEAVRHKMMRSRRVMGAAEVLPSAKRKVEDRKDFDPNVPCTLGLIVTEVVANSSLRANVEGALDITFPFTSDWPVSFRVIIEAWHDVTGFLFNSTQPPLSADRAGTLVARHASRLSVVAGQAWQTQRRVMTHAAR
ncbi:uncharacterized protein LOC108683061 [Hyalella azteca]|uniref:Uncharacterized protein LOC108683061 n=1 Tax=Hyalella azteca TaxID=294128 RepID=A0A8B7PQS3_HYAAZ|nr:uncharacterized protein LOC108683061 [Hyalella azteca]